MLGVGMSLPPCTPRSPYPRSSATITTMLGGLFCAAALPLVISDAAARLRNHLAPHVFRSIRFMIPSPVPRSNSTALINITLAGNGLPQDCILLPFVRTALAPRLREGRPPPARARRWLGSQYSRFDVTARARAFLRDLMQE